MIRGTVQFRLHCLGVKTVDGALANVVPLGVANLGAKKKLVAQPTPAQPSACSHSAVNFTSFAVQMNAVAAQPEVLVKGCFVAVRAGR